MNEAYVTVSGEPLPLKDYTECRDVDCLSYRQLQAIADAVNEYRRFPATPNLVKIYDLVDALEGTDKCWCSPERGHTLDFSYDDGIAHHFALEGTDKPKMITGVWPKEVGNDTVALEGTDNE